MKIRYAKLEEREAVEELSKGHPYVKDFKYLWRLWKNWEKPKNMPIVVEEKGKFIGFSGVSFGKKYVNSYYRFVLPEYRGRNLNTLMLDFILKEAHKYEIPRFKFKMPFDVASLPFWKKRGIDPFGTKDNQYFFDLDISTVSGVEDLKPTPIPSDILEKYREKGVIIL